MHGLLDTFGGRACSIFVSLESRRRICLGPKPSLLRLVFSVSAQPFAFGARLLQLEQIDRLRVVIIATGVAVFMGLSGMVLACVQLVAR